MCVKFYLFYTMWGDLYVLSTKPKVDPKIKDGEKELKQRGLNKQSNG